MTVTQFITRLMNIYGQPKSEDVRGFFDEYREILKSAPADALKITADEIVRTEEFWPRPATLYRHLNVVLTRLESKKRHVNPEHAPFRDADPDPESRARVDALFKATVAKLKTITPTCGPGRFEATPEPYDTSRPAFEAMQKRNAMHRGQP